MHRLFVALVPPADVRDALIDTMEGVEGARWQDEAALHLTLRFMGEVARPVANDLADALSAIVWPRFALAIAGVGTFDRSARRGGQPHAVWARVIPSADLEGLRQKVERACELAGLPRETRRFTPHVTLARLNAGSGPIANWLTRCASLAAGPWTADGFTLFESHLGRTGAHYEAIAEYPLQGRDSRG